MSAFERTAVGINAVALLAPLTGIGQYTFHLARELGQLLPRAPWLFYGRDWDRELRTPPATPPPPGIKQAVGRLIPKAHKVSRFLQQRRFSAGVRAHDIGLYHEPNYLAFEFAGPSVVTVHDLSWIRYPAMHPAERVELMNATMPRVMRQASQVIVDSEFVRREVLEHYGTPAERVTTVPLGVSPGFRAIAREGCRAVLDAHGLEFGAYVLAVGTLEPRKNLATVVAAFSLLGESERRRHPLVIAGMEGWGAQRLPKELQRMIGRGEARMAGYVAQQDLPMLYAGARVFVYPSLYEGFGLPPLEAMASGVPVIASNRASLPELVGDAGVLIEPLDASALAEKLRAFLGDDALRDAHSRAVLERAAAFTWRRTAAETLDVYRRAMAS